MYIQIKETPNPDSLMFFPGQAVTGSTETYFFNTQDTSIISPLARKLLDLENVKTVFLGDDFITIGKEPEADWYVLKPFVLGTIMEHYINQLPIIDHGMADQHMEALPGGHLDLDNPVIRQINDIIDSQVRPAVAADGGDIVLQSFEDGIVYVMLKGACSGCPSSTITLKSGIESMLKFYVPEVLEVRAVGEVYGETPGHF